MPLTLWLPSQDALDAFTPGLGVWMATSLALSSALGGYLAGRLHPRGVGGRHVHWRGAANGLLVWAASTGAGLLLISAKAAPQPGDLEAVMYTRIQIDLAAFERAANISGEAALFVGAGMVAGALIAAAAFAVGGMRRDGLYGRRSG